MLKATIIGNLGGDADVKYSASGSPYARFNVAANFRVKNDQNEWTDRTEWVRCTLFGNRAESLSRLLTKGTKVYLTGPLEARPWTDQQGGIRAGLELRVDDVELMSPRQQPDESSARASVNDERAGAGYGEDRGDLDALPF